MVPLCWDVVKGRLGEYAGRPFWFSSRLWLEELSCGAHELRMFQAVESACFYVLHADEVERVFVGVPPDQALLVERELFELTGGADFGVAGEDVSNDFAGALVSDLIEVEEAHSSILLMVQFGKTVLTRLMSVFSCWSALMSMRNVWLLPPASVMVML